MFITLTKEEDRPELMSVRGNVSIDGDVQDIYDLLDLFQYFAEQCEIDIPEGFQVGLEREEDEDDAA